ncbi:MAG: chemotaxis protein CheA [Candidatus Vecturithrix sp.]|jgi:two-component system chemotaxis sensor kinase CheA|nr:chemotaxis protein CheA [Candidatus Vecturithrix sp.]
MGTTQLIREFLAEAEEHLLTLEPNLLRLEKEPANRELITEIFLATHSMKGTAAYVGLAHISSFLHTLESLLEPVRQGSMRPTPECIDALLHGVDVLKDLIRHVAEGKAAPDTTEIVTQLTAWQQTMARPFEGEGTETVGRVNVPDASGRTETFNAGTPDQEDCEVFADISRQQLEMMRLALEKVHASSLQGDVVDAATIRAHVETMVKACRTIQSSAAMLNVEPLDAALAEHIRTVLTLEHGDHGLTDQDLTTLTHVLQQLETIIADFCARNAAETPAELSLPLSATTDSISPSVEWSQGRSLLRVDAERVDELLNLVSELVITRARLADIGGEIKAMYEDLRTGEVILHQGVGLQRKKNVRLFKKLKERLDETTSALERLTNQMQEATMRIRMVPISQVLSRFPRMVRDLARQAGKEVQIVISGAETELDKTVIDLIGDPLIHLIRNAIDHGIETPDERINMGKPHQGTIMLSAYYEGNQVILAVNDDGRGIDRRRIMQKAVQLGIIGEQEAKTLPKREALALIFASGLSTVEAVSSLSGRGVGLNVVKRAVEKISGAIELNSRPGQGCTFLIKLPLTLAIIPALLVSVNTELFAIPLAAVEEAIRLDSQDLHTIETQQVMCLRGRIIPVFDLAQLLGRPYSENSEVTSIRTGRRDEMTQLLDEGEISEARSYGVILSDGEREIGLMVDALCGEGDMVIKSLKHQLLTIEGISGASIRGDGQVSLVLDAASLINLAMTRVKKQRRIRSQRV